MDLYTISILWLVLALLVINFVLVTVNQSAERFWHPAVFLWLALLFLNIVFGVSYNHPVDNPVPAYETGGSADPAMLHAWKEIRAQEAVLQRKIFRLLAAQSFISLFLLVLGYQQSGTKMYRQAVFSFLAICLVMLALEIIFLLRSTT